jgi:hypothetical protein
MNRSLGTCTGLFFTWVGFHSNKRTILIPSSRINRVVNGNASQRPTRKINAVADEEHGSGSRNCTTKGQRGILKLYFIISLENK